MRKYNTVADIASPYIYALDRIVEDPNIRGENVKRVLQDGLELATHRLFVLTTMRRQNIYSRNFTLTKISPDFVLDVCEK